jgi:hypothetical protein
VTPPAHLRDTTVMQARNTAKDLVVRWPGLRIRNL